MHSGAYRVICRPLIAYTKWPFTQLYIPPLQQPISYRIFGNFDEFSLCPFLSSMIWYIFFALLPNSADKKGKKKKWPLIKEATWRSEQHKFIQINNQSKDFIKDNTKRWPKPSEKKTSKGRDLKQAHNCRGFLPHWSLWCLHFWIAFYVRYGIFCVKIPCLPPRSE